MRGYRSPSFAGNPRSDIITLMQNFKQYARKTLGRWGLFNIAQTLYQTLTPQGRKWGKKIRASEQSSMQLYRQFIKRGDLCFDVGANFGFRTAAFLKIGARVVAVEPQDVAMNNLRLRFGRNKRVVLVQAGADEAIGEREFFMGEKHVLSSMSSDWISKIKSRPEYKDHAWDKKVTVPVTTLDELIAQHGMPTFIKIDVEGFEYQVLKGLSQHVRALSFEYNKEFLEPVVRSIERLSSLGAYEFNYSTGETMRLALSAWTDKDTLLGQLEAVANENVSGDVYARLRQLQ